MADNALKHNYSMMQIKKKEQWENVAVIQAYTLKRNFTAPFSP
jgi:hypothetical protein